MGIFSKKPNEGLFKLLEDDGTGFNINTEEEKKPDKIQPSHAITVSEVLFETKSEEKNEDTAKISPLESLKRRVIGNTKKEAEEPAEPPVKSEEAVSLLQKCKPYIVDENGNDATTPKEPLYRLESVAEILENDSRSAIDRLAEKYSIMIDDLGHGDNKPSGNIKAPEAPADYKEETVTVNAVDTSLPDISDIDTFVTPKADEEPEEEPEGATIRFTPVNDKSSVTVSQSTNTVDLTNEIADLILPEPAQDETTLEKTDFDSFEVTDELKNPADAKRLLHKMSVKKRTAFLRMIISCFITLLLILCEIPPISDLILGYTETMMIICTAVLGISVILNADMFISLKNIFSKRSTPDVAAVFASLSTLAFSAVCVVHANAGCELPILCSVILSFRSISQFISRSADLGNLKQLTNPTEKKAVALITDEATTFAMAKNAIDGDVLIATPQETKTVTDFMKYSKFGLFMNGKFPAVTIISLILSLIAGFAASAIFSDAVKTAYSVAAVFCIFALPNLFLTESMPLHSSAKRLNQKGSMIAGKTAAQRLEMANAVVLTASDLFPSGSVTLHNIKVLSDNNIDDTILRAASLTDAVDSPLSPIFKQIAKSNSAYSIPDSDTVKYEERLGLSGWVGDELIFIGNRTLMEAHGIEVPDIKVDRQILEKGFFPVYIATGNKAMALIVVQYSANPDIVYELRKTTELGITLIVNNCDPNLTEEMICDYLDLYEGSVKIMSNAGVHMYKTACMPVSECSAPAVFRGRHINFITVMNTASKIKKSILLLNILYLLSMCIGFVIFAYASFSGGDSPLSAQILLLYELGATALSLLFYQAFKP